MPRPAPRRASRARSEYKLYVNGRYIGRGPGPCRPGSTYDTHDLSHVLRPGKNVIAAICYNCGVETASGKKALEASPPDSCSNSISSTTATGRSSSPTRLGVSRPPTTGTSTPPAWADSIGFQEVYDSRSKPVGWNVVGFDDADWEPAHMVGEADSGSLIPRQIPPLKEWDIYPRAVVGCGVVTPIDDASLDVATRMHREQTQPDDGVVKYPKELLHSSGECAAINSGRDSYTILDFGMEVVGYPVLKIRAAGHAVIDIGYSEALDENGRVDPTRGGILQADRLVLHGGRQELQGFGRRAFRYVQLTCRNLDSPISIRVRARHAGRLPGGAGFDVQLFG